MPVYEYLPTELEVLDTLVLKLQAVVTHPFWVLGSSGRGAH